MKTVRGSWYEVWAKKSFGCKLPDRYNNLTNARKAIKKAKEAQIALDYEPDEFVIMIVDSVMVYDEEGETISETITYARR